MTRLRVCRREIDGSGRTTQTRIIICCAWISIVGTVTAATQVLVHLCVEKSAAATGLSGEQIPRMASQWTTMIIRMGRTDGTIQSLIPLHDPPRLLDIGALVVALVAARVSARCVVPVERFPMRSNSVLGIEIDLSAGRWLIAVRGG